MSYGIKVKNEAGSEVFDSTLIQPHLVQSGTVSVTAKTEFLVTINPIQFPVVFMRAGIGVDFGVTKINATQFGIITLQNAIVDYRIYNVVAKPSPSGPNGLITRNTSGLITYDSNLNHTDIRARYLALGPSQGFSSNTFNHSVSAMNGGLPFVNADILNSSGSVMGGGFFNFDYYRLYCRHVSSTQILVRTISFDPPGNPPDPQRLEGVRPRYLYLIR